MQYVIIPGNPGETRFYEPFMAALRAVIHDQSRGFDVDVQAYSHDYCKADGSLVTMAEHIDQIQQLLKRVLVKPTVLIGHSVGSYMLLHALKNVDSGNILKVICVFPFFEADFSNASVRSVSVAARFYNAMGLVAGVLSRLPLWAKDRMFRYMAKDPLSVNAIATCCALFTRKNITEYFYLASQYVIKDKPFDWKLIEESKVISRITMYACPNDTWLSDNLLKYIRNRIPSLKVVWHPYMSHAFTVSDEMSWVLAHIVAREPLSSDQHVRQGLVHHGNDALQPV